MAIRSTGAQPYVFVDDVGTLPVTALELAYWLKMTDEDMIVASTDILRSIIAGCTYEAEALVKRLFFEKRFITYRDVFGDYGDSPDYGYYPAYALPNNSGTLNQPIVIRRSPLQTVEEISYVDTDGATIVMDEADYYIVQKDAYSMIFPTTSWPQIKPIQQGIKITFTAGYTTLPPNLKIALLDHCANAFMNRGDCGCECKKAPSSVQGAYAAMRIVDIV